MGAALGRDALELRLGSLISTTPNHRIPDARRVPFEVTFVQFVEEQLGPLLPAETTVRIIHDELMRYITEPDPLFITRVVKGQERGEDVVTRDGIRLRPSDNSPAWWWHMNMFHGVAAPCENFAKFVEDTPTHRFRVPSNCRTVNAAGWHAAHILNARYGDTDWRTWTRADAARRFIRNVHPLNLFYVPLPEWRRVAAIPELIGYVASTYATRWPEIWCEFTQVAGEPPLLSDVGDSILRIDSETDSTPWGFILEVGKPRQIASILCRHPDAEAFRRRLIDGLTLERFVALGKVLHNRTRTKDLEECAPGDPARQAEVAVAIIDSQMTERQCAWWIAKQHREESRWAKTFDLLRQGSDEGLEAVCRLDCVGLVTAALRVVTSPTICSSIQSR